MTNCASFHTRITTIMETITKSAIAEITQLFDDSSSVLCMKISRSLHENETLKTKLLVLQHELRTARGLKEEIAARENSVNTRSFGVQVFVEEQQRERVFGQECSFSVRRDGEPAGVEKSAIMEKVRTEPVLIKQEKRDEGLCFSDPQPTPAGEELDTEPTPVQEEPDTEPTPVEEEPDTEPTPVEEEPDTEPTPVEEEPDTEPTPVGDPEELSEQHRCGHGDEELSGLEFVVKAEQEEEHVAQRLSQTGCEHSAGRLNNLGSEYVMYERDSQLFTSFTQGDSDIKTDGDTGKMGTSDGQAEFGKKLFICTYCGKRFDRCSRLIIHHRIHTGEKPYSCAQCGKCFNHKGNLVQHERVHSRNKPFGCTQCGKRFTLATSLRVHQRIHTRERPYHCTQCGKSFARQHNFVVHKRIHTGLKPYSCN